MIEPNVLAFQNAAVLELLGQPQATSGVTTLRDLARAVVRDESNLAKTLKTLVSEGFLNAEPLKNGLTDAGLEQLAAYRRAKHGGAARRARGRWPLDKFRRNPDNRPVDRAHVEAIADTASEEGVGDILLPVLAGDADADGVRMIIAGEHRWEAAKLLLEQDRLPPDLQQGLPFIEREVDRGEVAIIACIENTARKDQSPWEDAKQLRTAADALKLTAPELGRRIGRTREGSRGGLRDIQSKLKVAREATPEAVAAYEADPAAPGAWETLRDSVSTPKANPFDDMPITKAHKLALAEMFAKAELTVGRPIAILPSAFQAEGARLEQYELAKLHRDDKGDTAYVTGTGAAALQHWDLTYSTDRLAYAREKLGFPGGWGNSKLRTEWLNTTAKPSAEAADQDSISRDAEDRRTEVKAGLTPSSVTTLVMKEKAGPYAQALMRLTTGHKLGVGWMFETSLRLGALYSSTGLGFTDDRQAFIDREQAIAAGRRALYDKLASYDAPLAYYDWLNALEGERLEPHMAPPRAPADPLVVNGVRHPNLTRANEARRAAGLLANPSNSGGGSRPSAPIPEGEPLVETLCPGFSAGDAPDDDATSPHDGALQLIAAERARQVAAESFSPDQDDEENCDGELADAAAAYAVASTGAPDAAQFWPIGWSPSMFKPTGEIRDLIKAGALIVAEIERRQRAGETA